MSNRALEAFLELSDDTDFGPKAKESEEFFENLLKDELLPFLKAAKDFFKKGTADFAVLGIEDEVAALNMKKKGAASKKQNEVLKESTTDNIDNVQVKKEKLTTLDKENDVVTKIEMPAPNWIPPKKKVKEIKSERPTSSTRSTRTKGGKKDASIRESDVIMQSPVIPVIDLSENEDAEEVQTRSHRTKTRAQTQDVIMDTTATRSTRTKTRNQKAENVNETVEMETRSTRTKTLRKVKKDEEVPDEEPEIEPRSTRTKTIRKAKDASEDEAKNSESDDGQRSTRNAKAKTIRKGKDMSGDEAKNSEVDESQMSTRSTRTKTIKKVNKVDANEDSDTGNEPTTRSTRTKTIKKQTTTENPADIPEEIPKPGNEGAVAQAKRSRSEEDDEPDIEQGKNSRKKSKSNSPTVDTTTQTVYEDAQSSPDKANVNEKPINSTYIAPNSELKPVPPLKQIGSGPSTVANAKKAVQEPSFNIFENKSENNLFTDDESLELKKSPKKAALKTAKEVFSPYEKSTIKKKVEAFERLQKVNEVPVKLSAIPRTRDTPVKDKMRLNNTPLSKFMPTTCSTSKVSRLLSAQQLSRSSSNDSLSVSRGGSTQKDPRERHRKMLEREQALKKKEAMLLAQAEAKKKQNEEKQLKAQQQRKLIEAEKLKQLELQKQKEDRQKQRELEREEYTQKHKSEIEKKREAQKKKIQELQEQRKAVQEAKELEEHQSKAKQEAKEFKNPYPRKPEPPIYMTTNAARLPTDDCYDSDDPEYRKPSSVVPSWRKDNTIKLTELGIMAAGEKMKNTFYCIHAQTIDLAEIFQNIDRRKLQRTSSRLWKKAPRYTMMPDLDETKFSDDDLDDEVFDY